MSTQAVAASPRGQVLYCPGCGIFHLEFGNVHLALRIEHLVELWEALRLLDGADIEQLNAATAFRRKILVPVRHGSANMVFSAAEIAELVDLLERAVDRAVLPPAHPRENQTCPEDRQA